MLNAKPLSLKRRVLGASSWSLAGLALSNLIRLGSSLLMTRLLVPEMFGVMAIAVMVHSGLAMFSDVGLKQNIIQSKRGADPDYLNTAWAVQIMRGVLLWLLGISISLLILAANHFSLFPKASVYANPLLPYVVAVVCASAVISGFQSTKFHEASRRLSLRLVTKIQIISQIAGLTSMIGWTLMDRSIWALVSGYVCSSAVTTLLGHLWLPGITNRWRWDPLAFHEIIHFGKWMFLSSILGFFANNADRLLLGGYVDSTTLGVYSIALTFSSAILRVLNTIFSQVSYPALSEVARERPHELKRSLYRFHIATASFSYFCCGVLVMAGRSLISLLYDARYLQAGWMLQILAVGMLAYPFGLSIYCLLARGLAKNFTGLIAVRGIFAIVFIPVGFHLLGVVGAIWGVVVAQLLIILPTIYYQIKYDLFDLSKELLIFLAFVGGIVTGKGFNLLIGY